MPYPAAFRTEARDEIVTQKDTQNGMAAEAYISRLGERGIEYVFANAGTDFAPIVEALSTKKANGKVPQFMVVPHENVAMAMAHGYYRIAGKPAAVMVHVTVGTANTLNGVINAARDNIPILLAAGRTPITETGSIASRNRPIHWGQEAFDQGGMLREYVKWDYELRSGQPVEAVVDRALDIAMSEPRGPVYLTLPREVLSGPIVHTRRDTVRPLGTLAPEPAHAAIEQATALIAKAEFPLIITSAVGRVAAAVGELAALAQEFAIPVVQAEARDMNLPTDHPMHLGHNAGELLAEGRRRDRDRQRGAVDAAQHPAAQGCQGHPHLGRSARDALSVPRAGSRPLCRRLLARRHGDAAQDTGRRDEGQERPRSRAAARHSPACATRSSPSA